MGDAAIFFNAQRVGSGSDSDKRKGIAAIALYAAMHLQKRMSVKAVFLSEVTSDFNVTERLTLQTQQKVSKQTKKKSSAQLGYAAFCGRKVLALSYHTPADRPFDASVKKGLKKQWTQISKRKAVFVQDVKVGGAPVVVYHANSSAFGQWLVAWLTLDLDNRCGGNFILMGDFNTEPANLRKAFNVVHIGTNTRIIAPTKATHRGGKVLDYIVVGRNVSKKVNVTGFSSPNLNSDHCPIVVYEV